MIRWPSIRPRAIDAVDADVRAEMNAHVDSLIAANIAAGDSPDDARRHAEARFGSRSQLETRATRFLQRRWRRLTPQGHEWRQTWRTLRRAPWYSATVVGVMGLGLALATTTFAIVDGVLFKPLALPGASQLMTVQPGFTSIATTTTPSVSAADVSAWAAATPNARFTAFSASPWIGLGEGVNDDVAGMAQVQPNVFDVLGVRPAIGGFEAADFQSKTTVVPVIVTDDVWRRRFGADRSAIGRTVIVDRSSGWGYRVVGVMPQGFVFPAARWSVRFITPYVPAAGKPDDPPRRDLQEVIARMDAGTPPAALVPRIEAGMAAMAASRPPQGPTPDGWSDRVWRAQGPFDRATVTPLSEALGRALRPLFSAVFVAAIVIVLLGALNLSALMASRILDRRSELDLRRALGATPLSLARLVFLEALLLIGIGGVVGLACAPALLHLAMSLLPEEMVLLKTPAIDGRVVAFVALAAITLAAPTSIWPALRALRSKRTIVVDGGRATRRARSAASFVAIATQVAAAFALTVTGALLISSVLIVYGHDRPIRTADVVVVETMLQGPGGTMQKSPERNARAAVVIDALRQVHGVEAVGMTSAEILRGGNWPSWFTPPANAPSKRVEVDIQAVTADYYKVLEPNLVAGRFPTDDEQQHRARLLVVSEGLARAYWGPVSPIGLTLSEQGDAEPYTIVGVVKDVRWFSWDREAVSIYGPYALLSRAPMFTFVLRVDGPPARVTADALRAIGAADPLLHITRAAPLDAMFVESIRPRRFQSWLFGSFAAAALAVIGIGIFGLLSMSAARRTREIGIRQALGASRQSIARLLAAEQLRPVAAGLAVGTALAYGAGQSVKASLYQVSPHDARVWTAAAVLLAAVAIAGTLVPAVRASRVDPVRALRVE